MGYLMLKIFPEIMSDPRLRSLEERLILCHLWDFQVQGKHCFTSNARIASFLACSEAFVDQTIFSLTKRGIIQCKRSNASTTRMLSVVTPGSIIEEAEADDLDIFSHL